MKWLKILASLRVLIRLRDPQTWREPSTWASTATAILSAVAIYFGLSESEYEALLAGVLGCISSIAGVLLPESREAAPQKREDPEYENTQKPAQGIHHVRLAGSVRAHDCR